MLGMIGCAPEPDEQLLEGIRSNDLSVVREALARSANTSRYVQYGTRSGGSGVYAPLLSYAVIRDASIEILDAIWAENPRLQTDMDGATPVHYAATFGKIRAMDWLLSIAEDPANAANAKNGTGATPIHLASTNCDPFIVERLIQAGVHMDARTDLGRTPVMAAAEVGCGPVVGMLVDQGADTSIRDVEGRVALHYAAKGGDAAAVEAIIATNRQTISATDVRGVTPLMMAARGGWESTVRMLLDRGASVVITDSDGRTPLIWATLEPYRDSTLPPGVTSMGYDEVTKERHSRTVMVLLEHGASPSSRDARGKNALEYAAENDALKGTEAFFVLSDSRF